LLLLLLLFNTKRVVIYYNRIRRCTRTSDIKMCSTRARIVTVSHLRTRRRLSPKHTGGRRDRNLCSVHSGEARRKTRFVFLFTSSQHVHLNNSYIVFPTRIRFKRRGPSKSSSGRSLQIIKQDNRRSSNITKRVSTRLIRLLFQFVYSKTHLAVFA